MISHARSFDEDALTGTGRFYQLGVFQPALLYQRERTIMKLLQEKEDGVLQKLAGLKEVPVVIREFTDQEIVEIP